LAGAAVGIRRAHLVVGHAVAGQALAVDIAVRVGRAGQVGVVTEAGLALLDAVAIGVRHAGVFARATTAGLVEIALGVRRAGVVVAVAVIIVAVAVVAVVGSGIPVKAGAQGRIVIRHASDVSDGDLQDAQSVGRVWPLPIGLGLSALAAIRLRGRGDTQQQR